METTDVQARYTAFHSAAGAILYVLLGAAWALVGLLELRPVGMPWVAIGLGLGTGVLLILSIRAIQRAGGITDEDIDGEIGAERGVRTARTRRVLRIEGILITVVTAVLFMTQNHAYVAPATALVVGLHFVALAPIHKTVGEGVVGALIVLLSIATMIWVPRMPSIHRVPMNIAAGFGTAAVLWAGAIVMLVQERRNGA